MAFLCCTNAGGVKPVVQSILKGATWISLQPGKGLRTDCGPPLLFGPLALPECRVSLCDPCSYPRATYLSEDTQDIRGEVCNGNVTLLYKAI
jgi:hypothetical protein